MKKSMNRVPASSKVAQQVVSLLITECNCLWQGLLDVYPHLDYRYVMNSNRCNQNSSTKLLGESAHLCLSGGTSATTVPKLKFPCLTRVHLNIYFHLQAHCLRLSMFCTSLPRLIDYHPRCSLAFV